MLIAWYVFGFAFEGAVLLAELAGWVGGAISPGAGASVTGISEELGDKSDDSPEPKSEKPRFNSKPYVGVGGLGCSPHYHEVKSQKQKHLNHQSD